MKSLNGDCLHGITAEAPREATVPICVQANDFHARDRRASQGFSPVARAPLPESTQTSVTEVEAPEQTARDRTFGSAGLGPAAYVP